eukprot:Rhum_TRINITY_DN4599_c2_g1::Rhum_TRINITY_DN4599_c2_g1_i1::g.14995::m.14995
MEHLVLKELRAARQVLGDGLHRLRGGHERLNVGVLQARARQESDDVLLVRALVEGDRHLVVAEHTHVDFRSLAARHKLPRRQAVAQTHVDGVEVVLGHNCVPGRLESLRQRLRLQVDVVGDVAQPVGAVPHGVEAGDVGEESLRGADVRRGLLTLDVLLTRLQRHAERVVSLPVAADTDDATRRDARVLLLGGEVGGVRATEAEGHAEALRGPAGDVGAELARRGEEGQRQEVGGAHGEDAVLLRLLEEGLEVLHGAVRVRVLHDHAAEAGVGEVGLEGVTDDEVAAEALGTGLQECEGGGVQVRRGEGALALGLVALDGKAEGLSAGSRLVEEGGVGQGQAGQVDDNLLEVHQRLQAALRDLGLVRCVRRVPAGALQHVAQDDVRGLRLVVAHADALLHQLVLRHHVAEPLEPPLLAQHLLAVVEVNLAQDRLGHHGLHKLGHVLRPDGAQHRLLVEGGEGIVPGLQAVEVREVVLRPARHLDRLHSRPPQHLVLLVMWQRTNEVQIL